jgi:hypothetical protein
MRVSELPTQCRPLSLLSHRMFVTQQNASTFMYLPTIHTFAAPALLKHSGAKVWRRRPKWRKVAAVKTWLALIWLTFTENAIMNALSGFWFWMAFQEPVTEIHSWDPKNKTGRRAAEPATLGERSAGF